MSAVLISRVPKEYSRNPEKLQIHEEFTNMSGAVQVQGLPGKATGGGTKEAQVKFRKHHIEVGDALLNLAEGIDQDEPRPQYVKQEFPMMVYHPEKGELIVEGMEDLPGGQLGLKSALKAGYRRQPFQKVAVAVLDPATEKLELLAKLRQKDGEIATLTDLVLKINTRLEKLEKGEDDADDDPKKKA